MANEADFDFLKENLDKYPELKEAFFNPVKIGEPQKEEKIVGLNKVITLPLLMCDNPDIELPKIPNQLNFIVPTAMRKSKEIYVINIKNDINMYKKLYENNSSIVNKIIDETKVCLKNLYNPLKILRDNVKDYSNNFHNSINKLSIPLENGKKGLNDIDYKKYPKAKQSQFLEDKKEIINEIDKFLNEANDFYKDYKDLNQATSEDVNNFVERFNKLAMPAKELTTFMRNLMEAFENTSSSFNDFNKKEKIDEALQKIKEPVNEFHSKSKNLENLLNSIKTIKIEKLTEMIEISNKIKDKINKLKASSNKITEDIKKIRHKYGEPEEPMKDLDMPPAAPINSKEASDKIEEQGKGMAKIADKGIQDISEDINKIKSQTRLDLLFIMDITKSMDDYLNQVKNDILKIISIIQKECAGIDIYLGFIGYKDFNDLDLGEEYIDLDFTTDYESIKKNIDFIKPSGGGDTPEDLCGGLVLGKKKTWIGKTRFAILVTDSPCHGKKYHDLSGENKDNYPEGDREKRNIEDYIEFFAKNDISLFCLKINETTDKMFKIFAEIYKKSKNNYNKNR